MSANSSSKGKRELVSLTFRPAKGGVVSESEFRIARGGQGGGPIHDYDRETAVHPTHESAAEHLKKHIGHAYTDTDEANRETPADEE